jgi:hypothetical protein
MVIGELKIESVSKVKSNKFYGNYEVRNVYTRTIINEKYEGLISPNNGIVVTIKSIDGDKLTFTIDKHYYTGELPENVHSGTTFSTSFGYGGCIYEIEVDVEGNLVSFSEWFSRSDFEDCTEPDNHYTAKGRGIKWELLDR